MIFTGIIMVGVPFCALGEPAPEKARIPNRSAKGAGVPKSADRRETFLQRFSRRGNESDPFVALPKDLDAVAPSIVEGRVNLPLANAADLGEPLTTPQFDEILASEFDSGGAKGGVKRIPEDQFVRRVYLDVLGRLPAPADIDEYLASKDPDKKAKLIDRLLAMPQYGVNWARYWRDVIRYRSPDENNRPSPFGEEAWLASQFNDNVGWDEIATALLTVRGLSTDEPAGFFFATYRGEQAELAGESARIFLGTQIGCAQCHDHPSDTWKRDQFHEFASFFGKTAVRLRPDLQGTKGQRFVIEIGDAPPRRQYRKPDLKDPSKAGEIVQPVFLTGQAIPQETSDSQRRESLAAWTTSKRNPLFAKAFVNRAWAELIGQGFTNPVDDLGQQKEVAYPRVFEELSRSFAASNYDVKRLVRLILNSSLYDRQYRELEGFLEDEALFENIHPTRLTADQIFDAIDWVLGDIDDGRTNLPIRPGNPGMRRSPRAEFQAVFGFDPSQPREELDGTIPQALALMNNPTIHDRLDADKRGTLLNKLLATQPNDKEVLRMLYLRVLARKPTSGEISACQSYIRQVGNRAEAFEDILWSLLNTTEFLHNH
ncbi:MAG: DUF1553 domain-containing protein [Planctomycetota bacterium]